jgi:hypothetical protein
MRKFVGVIRLLIILSFTSDAKDKHLPLAPQLIAAKTVYILNRSGNAAIGDRAYQEMKSWGRFQIVSDKTQADLIFLLTTHAETYGYVTTGGNQVGGVDDSGNMETTATPRYTTANRSFYSGLAILDAKTGEGLWAESKAAAPFRKSAIKRAVDELRKRIEEETLHKTH